ncbi:MAG TPA: hypothetical protein VIY47_15955 [Ignavibacteriaceae bacterium]
MKKEKVFIVISHKNSLRRPTRKGHEPEWEVTELVEFVNQIKSKHTSMSTAIGDYINRKMISGSRYGMTEYDKFEDYIRTKYPKQMAELDKHYREQQVKDESPAVIVDKFGVVRAPTVFDVV